MQSATPGSLTLKISKRDAGGSTQVTIIAAPSDKPIDPKKRRDESYNRTNGNKVYSNRKKLAFKVGDREAPGFQLDWKISGQDYRVQQCYLAEQGFDYTVAVHSPVAQFKTLEPTFEKVRKSFQLVVLSEETKRRNRLHALASKCGSELPWARNWNEAARKARAEKKPF